MDSNHDSQIQSLKSYRLDDPGRAATSLADARGLSKSCVLSEFVRISSVYGFVLWLFLGADAEQLSTRIILDVFDGDDAAGRRDLFYPVLQRGKNIVVGMCRR